MRLVGHQVLHVRHGLEAGFQSRGEATAVTSGEITLELRQAYSICLRQAVALDEVVRERGTQQLVQGGVQRSAATDHSPNALQAKVGRQPRREDAIPQEVLVGGLASRELHVLELGADHVAGHGAAQAGGLEGVGADGGAETVVQAGDGDEGRGPQDLHVIDEAQYVAPEVANGTPRRQSVVLRDPLVDVRQRQVGDEDVGRPGVRGCARTRRGCGSGGVRQDHALGVPGRS